MYRYDKEGNEERYSTVATEYSGEPVQIVTIWTGVIVLERSGEEVHRRREGKKKWLEKERGGMASMGKRRDGKHGEEEGWQAWGRGGMASVGKRRDGKRGEEEGWQAWGRGGMASVGKRRDGKHGEEEGW